MPFPWLKDYLVVHKHFVLRPNPYVTKEESQNAYSHYITFNWLAVSGFGKHFH